jgi:hypothetical protein
MSAYVGDFCLPCRRQVFAFVLSGRPALQTGLLKLSAGHDRSKKLEQVLISLTKNAIEP